jgi:HEAT repeat protein
MNGENRKTVDAVVVMVTIWALIFKWLGQPLCIGGERVDQGIEVTGKSRSLPRERLRYDGRSFDDWRDAFEVELKVEPRVEAMKALATFGRHGYRDEATAIIAPALRDDDAEVRTAAVKALRELSPLPEKVLHEVFARAVELEKTKRAWSPGGKTVLAHEVKAMELTLTQIDVDALTPVIDALGGDDEITRIVAAELLGQMGRKAIAAETALLNVLSDKNGEVRGKAAGALWSIAPDDKAVLAALVKAVKDDQANVWPEVFNKLATVQETGSYEYYKVSVTKSATSHSSSATIVTMVALSDLRDRETISHGWAIDLLGELGSKAKSATPLLKSIASGKAVGNLEPEHRQYLAKKAAAAVENIQNN